MHLPATLIATPRGEVAAGRLREGDRVITRDNGLQRIKWVGLRSLTPRIWGTHEHLAPIRIAQGALGNDLPERDMIVSPNQRILVAADKTALHFETSEVLVAAKHLTGLAGVGGIARTQISYLHFGFARHEVLLTNGVWSEFFQPGLPPDACAGNAQRLEILEVFALDPEPAPALTS
jgi:hypothetical protein